MTAVFEKHGLQFQYPENWTLQHDVDGDTVEIQLVAPSGAFWSLLAFPRSAGDDAQQGQVLMEEVLNSLREQYDSLEVSSGSDQFGKVTAEGYDAHFFCLDMLILARIRYFKGPQHHLIQFCQAESREFSDTELVFKAITIGMLGLNAKSAEVNQFTAQA